MHYLETELCSISNLIRKSVISSEQCQRRGMGIDQNFIPQLQIMHQMRAIDEYPPLLWIPSQVKLFVMTEDFIVQVFHLFFVGAIFDHMLPNQILQASRRRFHGFPTSWCNCGSDRLDQQKLNKYWHDMNVCRQFTNVIMSENRYLRWPSGCWYPQTRRPNIETIVFFVQLSSKSSDSSILTSRKDVWLAPASKSRLNGVEICQLQPPHPVPANCGRTKIKRNRNIWKWILEWMQRYASIQIDSPWIGNQEVIQRRNKSSLRECALYNALYPRLLAENASTVQNSRKLPFHIVPRACAKSSMRSWLRIDFAVRISSCGYIIFCNYKSVKKFATQNNHDYKNNSPSFIALFLFHIPFRKFDEILVNIREDGGKRNQEDV